MPARHGDAAFAHLVAQVFTDIVIETTKYVLTAINQRHLAAKTGEDAGKFYRDVAAALNDDALGKFSEIKRLVRRDHMFVSGNVRPHVRPGAGRDQNCLSVHARP